MVFRTEQDKINRKEANRRYYNLEENKQQKRDYMKEYSKRPYVMAKRKKLSIYPAHEEWARDNGYRDKEGNVINDALNTKNTISFKNGAER